jgi:hypothetical protein
MGDIMMRNVFFFSAVQSVRGRQQLIYVQVFAFGEAFGERRSCNPSALSAPQIRC